MTKFLLVLATLLCSLHAYANTDIDDSSGPTQQAPTTEEINALISSDVAKALGRPDMFAFGAVELKAFAEHAKKSHQGLRAKTETGDSSKAYDVILQPGHFPRTQGRTGTQGKYVTEQEFAARIVEKLAEDLRGRGINVALIEADGYNKPLHAKIFLALHAEGSNFPCSSGPSVGYSGSGDAKGMHGIALALALTLGIDPVRFMRDNYTANLRSYYAFRSMQTSAFKGLLEMGELTCPGQEELMLSRAELLAKNLAIAVVFALRPSAVK